MPRPQVPRQENKVNNNIKVEMEKRLLSHQLDVSGGSKRPTRNLYQMNQTLNIQWKWVALLLLLLLLLLLRSRATPRRTWLLM